MVQSKTESAVIGFTDSGAPIVLSEHTCANWFPDIDRTVNIHTCWYCRWADFRKTTDATLAQSICRCPKNCVEILRGNENDEKLNGKLNGKTDHAQTQSG